jgi:hypothetical protein
MFRSHSALATAMDYILIRYTERRFSSVFPLFVPHPDGQFGFTIIMIDYLEKGACGVRQSFKRRIFIFGNIHL